MFLAPSEARNVTSDDLSDYNKRVQGLAANGHPAIRPFTSSLLYPLSYGRRETRAVSHSRDDNGSWKQTIIAVA